MTEQSNPYLQPVEEAKNNDTNRFKTLEDVPFYHRQYFFWIFFFIFPLVAFLQLVTVNVYYRKKVNIGGQNFYQIVPWGIANRLIGAFFILSIFISLMA